MTLFFTRNVLPLSLLSRNLSLHKLLESKSSTKTTYENLRTVCTTYQLFKRRKTAEERKLPNRIEISPKAKGELVDVWRNITMNELAELLHRDINYVSDLFLGNIKGRNTEITDMKELQNAIRRSGKRMKIVAKPIIDTETVEYKEDVFPRSPPSKSQLRPRPPIVTVMGHVDHGKTTLLDALRHSNVVDKEFGGITQHIGAFSVTLESGSKVTFLDTPGHAAFTAMRERGANLTDIVVLVVAADDGVMEQTVESIRMARQAKVLVPIIIAINKIDSSKADIENTEKMLLQRGIQIESLGGDIQAVHISALKRLNLNQLTEALALQAEIMEIGGDPTGPVEAVVVDSKVDTHKGSLCTVIVQRGTLKKGDVLVADTAMAKVRLLRDAQAQILKEVGPGFPAEIEGWKDLPSAGEIILQVDSEKRARGVIKIRKHKKEFEKRDETIAAIQTKEAQHEKEYKEQLKLKRSLGRFKLRNIGSRKPEIIDDADGMPFLNLVIKSDVDGTLEAILQVLSTYNCPECKMDIISYGVGTVTETDVELAKLFKGVVYAFNVGCSSHLEQKANGDNVKIKHHNVIYKLVDEVKEDINKCLPLKQVEYIVGEATVLQQFFINEGRKKVPIAGCRCEKGALKRLFLYRIIRNSQIIHEGSLASMRYLKNEVDTIKTDSDCGLQFVDRSVLFEVGDKIVCYENKMEIQTVQWDPGF